MPCITQPAEQPAAGPSTQRCCWATCRAAAVADAPVAPVAAVAPAAGSVLAPGTEARNIPPSHDAEASDAC